MTESKSRNYEIFTKEFSGKEIEFINLNEEIWITAEALGYGLGYKNPRKSVMKLYYTNADELEGFKGVIEMVTPGGPQEVTIFQEKGAYLLIMFSKQPRAKLFRRWAAAVIKNIRQNGYHAEIPSDDPFDLLIRQTEVSIKQGTALKKAIILLKEQNEKIALLENKVSTVDTELKTFEQKYEEEKLIAPKTRKKIRDLVHGAVRKTGNHYNFYYSKIWQKFDISSTKDIPEKIGVTIVDWILKDHAKFVYGTNFHQFN